MSSHRRTAGAVSVVAALALITGCSSSSDTSGGSSAAPTNPTSSAATSAATSAASSTAGSSAASGELQGALLEASEIGTGFTVSSGEAGADSALPCTPGAKPLFTQFPPDQRVKQTYGNSGDTLAVTETIATYDAAAAQQAFAAAKQGFDCSSGSLGGSTVKIVKRPGGAATSELESAAWDFSDGKTLGTAAIIRIGSRIAAMTFAATSQSANDINVSTVLQKAAAKVAALG